MLWSLIIVLFFNTLAIQADGSIQNFTSCASSCFVGLTFEANCNLSSPECYCRPEVRISAQSCVSMSCSQAQFKAWSEWMVYSCEEFASPQGGIIPKSTSTTSILAIASYEAPPFVTASVFVAAVLETPVFVTTSVNVVDGPTFAASVFASSIKPSSELPATNSTTIGAFHKASATTPLSVEPIAHIQNGSSLSLNSKLALGLAIPGCIIAVAIAIVCLKMRRKNSMPCELEGTTVGSEHVNAQRNSWDFNDRKLFEQCENISPTDDDGQSLCRGSNRVSSQLLRSPMGYRLALTELPHPADAVGRNSLVLSPWASLTGPLPDANEIFPEAYDEKSVLREHGYGR